MKLALRSIVLLPQAGWKQSNRSICCQGIVAQDKQPLILAKNRPPTEKDITSL